MNNNVRKKRVTRVNKSNKNSEVTTTENENVTSIQWFPGHMAKTRRLITANLKLVDLVLEITDARVPMSSRNPELDGLIETKPRIIMLNKSDNADAGRTKMWLDYYKKQGIVAIACDCKTGNGLNSFIPLVKDVLGELIERRENKGMIGRAIRIMVVGIPNVGKSSFINRLTGAKRARVEDRPGVTRDKQWVSLAKDIDLLDMPGVLWPKFDDPLVGEKLAFTGAVKDDVIDIEHLSSRLLEYLRDGYSESLIERYNLDDITTLKGYEILEMVGKKRGMLIVGGEVNIERASITVLDEYRGGKLGKITFELPPTIEK